MNLQTSLLTACIFALSISAGAEEKKKLSDRAREFSQTYYTPEAIDAKLKEWSEKEPLNPEPYIMAANAYGYLATSLNISKDTPNQGIGIAQEGGGFAIVDPKTQQQIGTIGTGKDITMLKKAGSILARASAKFPHRLDIFVGRMSLAETAEDTAALLAAGLDMLKAAQSDPDKMNWIDDLPLPELLRDKIVHELQGRIKDLFKQENDEADKAGYKLATEALRIVPDNVELLNDAAVYHCYKKEWQKARAFLVRAEKAQPKDLFVKLNLAKADVNLGQPEAARRKWDEVIKLAPKSDESNDARAEISKLSQKPGKK